MLNARRTDRIAEMEARDTLHFWVLTPVILPGVLGGEWAVWYPEKPICAVRRSTVIIPCSYDHPDKYGKTLKVQRTMWCHAHENCIDTNYVCHSDNINISPEFKDRAECLVKKKKCTLKINDIKGEDSGNYKFRFVTNVDGQIWAGHIGVDLQVSELQVEMTSSKGNEPREGSFVSLNCNTKSCSLTQQEITWYKNSMLLPGTNATLHFNNVSYLHSGKYSCALKDNINTSSPQVILDVQYPPRSTSVSVSPYGDIVEGSSVILTCSSNANPPVQRYTWFKNNRSVTSEGGSGQSYSITNVTSEDSGQYHCEVLNKHGAENSTAVTLTVAAEAKYYGPTIVIVVGTVLAVLAPILIIVIYAVRKKQPREVTEGANRLQSPYPGPHNDLYTALDTKNRSPEYDTLMSVRETASCTEAVLQRTTQTSIYENIQRRGSTEREN